MNKYSALISDFLHNCGDADKGFVNDTEWWIVNGSVKVQIFLTSLEEDAELIVAANLFRYTCLLYTSPSPRDRQKSRMPSSA